MLKHKKRLRDLVKVPKGGRAQKQTIILHLFLCENHVLGIIVIMIGRLVQ